MRTTIFCVYGSLLLVDPEPSTCARLREALTYDGFIVDVVADAEMVQISDSYDVVVADVDLPDLLTLQKRARGAQVVLLTAPERIEDAMMAILLGAFDYVTRPFFVEDVSLSAACAVARRRGPVPTSPLHLVHKSYEATR